MNAAVHMCWMYKPAAVCKKKKEKVEDLVMLPSGGQEISCCSLKFLNVFFSTGID